MSNELAVLQKDITDQISGKLSDLEKTGLSLPANYNPQNALKSAFFKLQETKDRDGNLALTVCTKESIANSLLDMVVQGLSPAKTQCYFIVYGNALQL
ncbi:recombinase RecT, partial [Jeotgalibaca porci]|uniref:recombinase RecT n=1 Tax=Jeotgalibaca porci TaxID=1868793 RepID=UPI0035A1BAC0